LVLVIYGGWGTLTWYSAVLPLPLLLLVGAWLLAWHSSLQHEVLHGHPTRRQAINDAIGFLPLSLYPGAPELRGYSSPPARAARLSRRRFGVRFQAPASARPPRNAVGTSTVQRVPAEMTLPT
jgi:hypothetical protein